MPLWNSFHCMCCCIEDQIFFSKIFILFFKIALLQKIQLNYKLLHALEDAAALDGLDINANTTSYML